MTQQHTAVPDFIDCSELDYIMKTPSSTYMGINIVMGVSWWRCPSAGATVAAGRRDMHQFDICWLREEQRAVIKPKLWCCCVAWRLRITSRYVGGILQSEQLM